MNLCELNLNPGVAIFLLILFVVLAGVAIFFLYRGIRKDRNRYITERLKSTQLTKDDFDEFVKRLILKGEKNTRFSLMMFEISEAKEAKESFGEKQYDNIIKTLVSRIYGVLPAGSKVCSYTYDTIAAYIDEDLDKKSLSDLASYCLVECKKPIGLFAHLIFNADLNAGLVTYNSVSHTTFEQLTDSLNRSLAAAKRSGRNRYVLYTEELGIDSDEYKYYHEIKSAIENDEFTLYYQPICDFSTKQPVAYESLLRWNHKTLGVVEPFKFLNIMEQSGDIIWVGKWAFDKMLQLTKQRMKATPDKHLVFSINLSAKQLSDPELVDDFRRSIKKYGVPPTNVCLEIAEYTLFGNSPQARENIEKLRSSGFIIAIDDFGLDMSSLRMLEKLNVNWVKLDRRFVTEAREDKLYSGIIDALVGYAKRNGCKIIPMGVEDDEMMNELSAHGILCGQGYLFGKPLSPEEIFEGKKPAVAVPATEEGTSETDEAPSESAETAETAETPSEASPSETETPSE